MNLLMLKEWSPYLVGIGIGILSWITFLLSDHALGCSTAFVKFSGLIEKLFRKKKVDNDPYYKKIMPFIDWQFMLVTGIICGAFISARLSSSINFTMMTPLWIQQFGHTPVLRISAALAGGIFMGIGSRWAGGCTSGHGISGTLQMGVASWLATAIFFAVGIGTTYLLYQ